MGVNLNRWVGTGNLTADPDLRSTPSGTPVCRLRIAVNERVKDAQSGEWGDKPNYFTVTVWGAQGENCARFLSKGRGVAIDGRLSWREWNDKDTGKTREAVEIVAERVQFLSSPQDGGGSAGGGGYGGGAPASDVPGDFASAPAGPGGQDDDIPF